MADANEIGRRVILILVFGMLASIAVGTTAFAQAGSTGGTIGKTDKSISGGEPTPAPRQVVPRKRAAPLAATSPYLGCFKDQPNRDLVGTMTNEPDMTSARCITICRSQGYAYAGTQYYTYCFCGNSFGHNAASNCNTPCAGNSAEMCGGGWANSIYRASQ
jgi:hypothetical protein